MPLYQLTLICMIVLIISCLGINKEFVTQVENMEYNYYLYNENNITRSHDLMFAVCAGGYLTVRILDRRNY